MKIRYAKDVVDCLLDFIDSIIASSSNGFNFARPMVNLVTKVRNKTWSLCSNFLGGFFKSFDGLTRYHNFLSTVDSSVKARLSADEDFETKHLQTISLQIPEAAVIEDLEPEPMPEET